MNIEPQEFKQEYQGEIIPMLPSDIPADDELLFDDPRLTKANSIYLTIQQKYFDEIVCGDMVTRSKPEPDIWLEALRRLNVEAKDAAAIEDSFNGVPS